MLQEGKLAKELFFICKGILKIVSTNNKGNPVTQFFLKENQFCSILSSLNQGVPSNESIVAACDAELIVFRKHNLLYLYKTIPYFKGLIDSITQQALYDKIQIRNAYMGEDATTRDCFLLFIVCSRNLTISVCIVHNRYVQNMCKIRSDRGVYMQVSPIKEQSIIIYE